MVKLIGPGLDTELETTLNLILELIESSKRSLATKRACELHKVIFPSSRRWSSWEEKPPDIPLKVAFPNWIGLAG